MWFDTTPGATERTPNPQPAPEGVMQLTANMQKALASLSRSEWRSAYDVQMSRGTLDALTARKLAEVRYGTGSIAFARTHIKYRLTEAGEAAVAPPRITNRPRSCRGRLRW